MNACANCGKPVEKKYCNHACQHARQWKDKVRGVDPNDISKTFKFPESQKKYITQLKGRSCSVCGLVEWREKEAPLIMDHINGDPEDNSVGNLRLVCANCDMQLPTYKAKNRGKGRHSRRTRYANGESY